MGSRLPAGARLSVRGQRAEAAPHRGEPYGRGSERRTRESLRELSGRATRVQRISSCETLGLGDPPPMAIPNRQICAQMMTHLTALLAIHTRRSARNRAKSRVTLGDQRPIGASARVPAEMGGLPAMRTNAVVAPELGSWRG